MTTTPTNAAWFAALTRRALKPRVACENCAPTYDPTCIICDEVNP